jgi:sn-glycerol 3-phosphate transport system permease protein
VPGGHDSSARYHRPLACSAYNCAGAVIKLLRIFYLHVMLRRYQPRGVSISSPAGMRATPAPLTCQVAAGRWRVWPATALLAPSAIFLSAFTYWPVLRVLGESFLVGRFVGQYRLGLENYQRLFADAHFARAALNNVVYAAGTIVPSLALALLFALALRETTRWNAVLRTLVVMPLLIPLVAAAALFSFILLPGGGLLDFYLGRFGVPMMNWLGDPDLALGSIIAITVWKNTGYYMLFFIAGLAGVPQDLLDAAKIDGAGALRRFRAVTLPMLGPTLGFVLPIALVNALTQIDHVVTMTQGGPSDATSLLRATMRM